MESLGIPWNSFNVTLLVIHLPTDSTHPYHTISYTTQIGKYVIENYSTRPNYPTLTYISLQYPTRTISYPTLPYAILPYPTLH